LCFLTFGSSQRALKVRREDEISITTVRSIFMRVLGVTIKSLRTTQSLSKYSGPLNLSRNYIFSLWNIYNKLHNNVF
jgi:hypothetical protein